MASNYLQKLQPIARNLSLLRAGAEVWQKCKFIFTAERAQITVSDSIWILDNQQPSRQFYRGCRDAPFEPAS